MANVDPMEFRRTLLRDAFLPLAIQHTQTSLQTARALLDAEFPSPAFVWAVRSAEVFFREALLFPIYYLETGDVIRSMKSARRFLGAGNWTRALELVQQAYELTGEHDVLLTEAGEDAWVHWRREGVGARGEIVHGRDEADPVMAQTAIEFVDRMRVWFTLRVISSDEGPFANVLQEQIAAAQARLEAASHDPSGDEEHEVDDADED